MLTTQPEVSRHMIQKYYIPRENGVAGEKQPSVVTLRDRDQEKEENDDSKQFANKSNRSATVVNFQDPNDETCPSRLLPSPINGADGYLKPEFENFGSQADFVAAYAITLLQAIQIAKNSGNPFPGTKTYTVLEPTNELDEDGSPILKEKEYILFAREKAQIDEFGEQLSKEERNERRREDIRYNGPKSLPLIPVDEVHGEDGSCRVICLGLTYAEQRNIARSQLSENESGVSWNAWLFGMGLYEFKGTLTDFYAKFTTWFDYEEANKFDKSGLLAGLVGHQILGTYDPSAPVIVAANLRTHQLQAQKLRKENQQKIANRRKELEAKKEAATNEMAIAAGVDDSEGAFPQD